MTNVTYPATLELMFVAKWLLSAPIETVEHDMGVTRSWIEDRLSLMASELAPGAYRTNAEVAKAYLYLKEDAPKRPGIVVPPGACDPTRWRDVLAASLGDQEVTPITQSQPRPLAANNAAPASSSPVSSPPPADKARHQPDTLVAKVEAGLGAQAVTTTELGERVHLNRSSVLSALRVLVAAGRAVAEGTRNRTRYRRTLGSVAPHHEMRAEQLPTQTTSMSITKTLEADLKRMQTEQQPTLMVQALRRRRDELTFADVVSILASPLGHGLASVQIRELFVGEAGDSPKLSTTPATRPSAAPDHPATRVWTGRLEAWMKNADLSPEELAKRASRAWMKNADLSPEELAKRAKRDRATVAGLLGREDRQATLRPFLDLARHAGARLSGAPASTPGALFRRLKELVTLQGLTIATLARRSGIHRTELSHLFNSPDPNPFLSTVQRIVAALSADAEVNLVALDPGRTALSAM